MSFKKISKSELLMNYFEDNTVLGILMMIKSQTKTKICSVNCKCCVVEMTCCLCSVLDYWIMPKDVDFDQSRHTLVCFIFWVSRLKKINVMFLI